MKYLILTLLALAFLFLGVAFVIDAYERRAGYDYASAFYWLIGLALLIVGVAVAIGYAAVKALLT